MIIEIKSTVGDKLKELFPNCRQYVDSIEQNFEKPSFFIRLIDWQYRKSLCGKFRGRASFDVAYFSDKPSAEITADCQNVQEIILKEFDTAGSFRPTKKQASIVDDILHITFDIAYSEIKNKTETKMKKIESNTNLKE